MQRIFGFILLLLGGFFVYGVFLNISIRISGGDPSFAVIIFFTVLAVICIWGGIKLWKNWQYVLGGAFLFFALVNVGNFFNCRRLTELKTGAESDFYSALSTAHILGITVFFLLGAVLIGYQLQRGKSVNANKQ